MFSFLSPFLRLTVEWRCSLCHAGERFVANTTTAATIAAADATAAAEFHRDYHRSWRYSRLIWHDDDNVDDDGNDDDDDHGDDNDDDGGGHFQCYSRFKR